MPRRPLPHLLGAIAVASILAQTGSALGWSENTAALVMFAIYSVYMLILGIVLYSPRARDPRGRAAPRRQ